jgi:hypothetical protein
MMRIVSGLLIAVVCASGTAFAKDTGKSGAKAVTDKVICKQDGASFTGSHLSARKVCLKASDWKELEDNKDRFFQGLNDRGGVKEPDPVGSSPQ